MSKRVVLIEQTNETTVEVIHTRSDRIEAAITKVLDLDDRAVIDTNVQPEIAYDSQDRYIGNVDFYSVSRDGRDWDTAFRVYDLKEGVKEIIRLECNDKLVDPLVYDDEKSYGSLIAKLNKVQDQILALQVKRTVRNSDVEL